MSKRDDLIRKIKESIHGWQLDREDVEAEYNAQKIDRAARRRRLEEIETQIQKKQEHLKKLETDPFATEFHDNSLITFEELLSGPFEWVEIPAGKVTIIEKYWENSYLPLDDSTERTQNAPKIAVHNGS